jgi:hypothetical protein
MGHVIAVALVLAPAGAFQRRAPSSRSARQAACIASDTSVTRGASEGRAGAAVATVSPSRSIS